ncbi:MAG TPA: hypothetical protein VGE10_05870, partial [Zeimonas sp.]
RREVLERALQVLGAELLQFGSDCFLPCSGKTIAERRGWVVDLLDEIGVDAAARERIWSGTAASWLRRDALRATPVDDPVEEATEDALSADAPTSESDSDRSLSLRPRCC